MRDLQGKFGFTPERVYEAAKRQLARVVASSGLPEGD
jgi:transketolase